MTQIQTKKEKMGKFTLFIFLTVSFLGCGNSDVKKNIDTPVVKNTADRGENTVNTEENTVKRRGGHKNDEEIISFKAGVWKYFRNEPPFIPPVTLPDATFYIPKSEDICEFVPQQYRVEHGSTQAQRAFYIKVYTGYTTVHIWKGVESDCRILKPVKKEFCHNINIGDEGKTVACGLNSQRLRLGI